MALESKTKVVEMLTLLCVKDFGDLDCNYLAFIGVLDSQAVCHKLNLEEFVVN